MRLIVDTNILVSGIGWEGPEARLLRRAVDGDYELVLSSHVLSEFARVMARPAFREIPQHRVASFLALLLRVARVVAPTPHLQVVRADPSDNRVLEAALEAACDLIVSGDSHLLDLERFRGIDVVRAPEALRRLG